MVMKRMAHSPDLMPFLLGGVTGPSIAAPGMATRCHPQLILEMKAPQRKKLGRERGEDTRRLLGWLLISSGSDLQRLLCLLSECSSC